MASLRTCGMIVVGLLGTACGGSDSSGGVVDAGGDASLDGSMDTSASGGDATANDGAPSARDAGDANDGASSARNASDANAQDANDASLPAQDASDANDGAPQQDGGDATADAPGAPCPDVRGAYSVTVVQGQGCTTLNASATQCIRQGQQTACGITFQSAVDAGLPAINGDASLQSDGTFANAALTEGTLARTGCTGTWDASTSTMTVDCGGTGSSQACLLAVQRTGSTCN